MRRKKRGFTLVEVVLAVAIAVAVSISATSVVLMSRATSNKATVKHNAVGQLGAILECFKSSDDVAEFKDVMEFVYGERFSQLTNSMDYELFFYFKADGTPATTYTDATSYRGEYSYFIHILIECNSTGDFTDANLKAQIYEQMPIGTNLSTVDKLKIYDLEDEFENGYQKGGLA